MNQNSRIRPLKALTSLRFFAAILVVFHHVSIFYAGYSGVTFFFILSGFIISYNYGGILISKRSVFHFWRKRIARIYPTHILTLLLALPLLGHPITGTVDQNKAALGYNAFLLQSWIPEPGVHLSLNSVSWSISDEAFFYFLCPLLLLAIARIGSRRSIASAAIWLLLVAVLAFAWPKIGSPTAVHWVFYINPAMRLVEFFIGLVMGCVFISRPRVAMSTASEVGVVVLALISLAVINFVPLSEAFSLSLAFVPAGIGLVWVFAYGGGWLSKIISGPRMLLLGEASFMLYMIHQIAIRYATLAFGGHGIVALCAGMGAVPLSIALYLWFERPLQRILNGRRPKAAAFGSQEVAAAFGSQGSKPIATATITGDRTD